MAFQMNIKLTDGIELHGSTLKNALVASDGNDRWLFGANICVC